MKFQIFSMWTFSYVGLSDGVWTGVMLGLCQSLGIPKSTTIDFESGWNLSQLTSTPIKVEPSVVRPCCLFLWIAVILKKCASTTSIPWRPTENFFGRVKRKHSTKFWYFLRLLGTLLKCGNPKIDGDRLKIGLKSLTAHVYANKSRTKGRTTLLFVSMDSCDPKEVCKYNKYTMETNQKIFRTIQRQTLEQVVVLFEDVGDLVKVWESQNRRRST